MQTSPMSQYHYDKVPFLPSKADEQVENVVQQQYEDTEISATTNPARKYRVILATLISLLVLNIAFLAWNVSTSLYREPYGCESPSIQQPFSPASSVVRYSIQQIDAYDMHASPFIGEPRLELDQAWGDLLRSTNIRVSEAEMRIMGKTSVALADGSGYLGYLEVHHMIHCLKRMKQFRHLEHYKDIEPKQFDLPHWDHCIEVLRRGIMCNADLMMDTVEWNKDRSWLQGVNRWPRKCVDWDSVQAFADARAVEMNHSSILDKVLPEDDDQSFGPLISRDPNALDISTTKVIS